MNFLYIIAYFHITTIYIQYKDTTDIKWNIYCFSPQKKVCARTHVWTFLLEHNKMMLRFFSIFYIAIPPLDTKHYFAHRYSVVLQSFSKPWYTKVCMNLVYQVYVFGYLNKNCLWHFMIYWLKFWFRKIPCYFNVFFCCF